MTGDIRAPTDGHDARAEMHRGIATYLNAFNRMDLAAVMRCFTPDALYEPGDGSRHVGLKAIARAFEPQLSYAYGAMLYEEEDLFIDPMARKATLRWICRIDATQVRFYSVRTWLAITLGRLRYGPRATYRGVDILHLDTDGQICAKLSYAQFGRLLLAKAVG